MEEKASIAWIISRFIWGEWFYKNIANQNNGV